jgi:hypothetical protein
VEAKTEILADLVAAVLTNWTPWLGDAHGFNIGGPAPEIAGGPGSVDLTKDL